MYFDDNPQVVYDFVKTNGRRYTARNSPDTTADLDIISKKNMRLTVTGANWSKEYKIALTPSEIKLARARTKPEADDDIDTFKSGNMLPQFNEIFMGFRSEKMDLTAPSKGTSIRIFKAPEAEDYSVEPNFQAKTIPLGIRAQQIRETQGNQLETVITNAASFEKSMSLNFGASGSFKGANSGWEATREESKGATRSDGTTKAFGLARSNVYVVLLDKTNMLLDDGFKFDILALARKEITPQRFREKYGTHYANAIHYGGIAKNERTVTSSEFKRWAKESTSYKQQGGFDGGPAASINAKGSLTMASGNAQEGTSMFSSETWSAIGGTGTFAASGWTVDQTTSVPVRYDLRPLSELISPVFLGKEWGTPLRDGLLRARQELDGEITRYLQSQPKPDGRDFGPAVYEVTFHSIECVNNGDEGKADAALYGKISARLWEADGEAPTLTLFDNPNEGNDQMIKCNGGSGIPIGRTAVLLGRKTGTDKNKFAAFQITTDGLFENDNSVTDLDDPLFSAKQRMPTGPLAKMLPHLVLPDDGWLYLKDWKADSPRTDLPETVITNAHGVNYGPDLRIKVSFKEIVQ
ncbi:MAC/perforin domain-containing protein [Novosphingobium sp.]|uniref:MAC/perforin domain-containing protein n=1 Tax=Novosphingobium sp. TaxID=1874826 RepID=UPI002631CE96|nr:MAC/perforin domain-containing protein [Novosphingobium sp.]